MLPTPKNACLPRLALFIALSLPACALAQSCGVDTNFNAGLDESAYVAAVTMQTNGQILIGGAFTIAGSPSRINLARLNHDGGLDTNFNAGTAVDVGPVASIAVQPDGKVLAAGSFYSSTGIVPAYIARLNTNGTVDRSFNPGLQVDGPINSVAVQPDGKILIAGPFVVVDGQVRRSIARLKSDGTLDASFDACVAGSPDGANAMVLLDDGKILMAGYFTFSTGVFRNGIARLNSNGDVDPNFAPEPGVNSGAAINSIAVRNDGNILIGGNFSSYHFITRPGIAQLLTASGGAVDDEFNPGAGIDDGSSVFSLALLSNGKVVLGGNFTSFNNEVRQGIARLNTDGTLDADCDAGAGEAPRVSACALTAEGKVMAGGLFSSLGTVNQHALVRLNGDPLPFHLGAPERLPGGKFQISFYGEPQVAYSFQTSSNLIHWVALTNFTCVTDPMLLTDPGTTTGARFYRALGVR